jgi:hypothetical protein
MDLIRLLQIFWYAKEKRVEEIERLRQNMASPIYDLFIGKRSQTNRRRARKLITTAVH